MQRTTTREVLTMPAGSHAPTQSEHTFFKYYNDAPIACELTGMQEWVIFDPDAPLAASLATVILALPMFRRDNRQGRRILWLDPRRL